MKSTIKVAVTYIDAASSHRCELPAILTTKGLLVSHLRYLAWYIDKSESWRERSVFSIRLLIDYIDAVPNFEKTTALLKGFTVALTTGTINYESSDDPLALFWKPRSNTDSNSILFHVTHYTDFLALQEGYEESRINPFRKATGWEERMNWCAYYHKHANVFLNHLSSRAQAKQDAMKQRLINAPQQLVVKNDKIVRFPDAHVYSLLNDGYRVRGKIDFRSQAMTMLLNFGGLRKSELFHIFTSDITLHPIYKDEALVRVYHPVYGKSPDPRYRYRKEYLASETSFKPRNEYRFTERLYAGWKSPLLTSNDGYFEVIFNPPEKAKEFLLVWVNYLKYQRVEPDVFHPFAFTNDLGEPDTVKNFQRRHRRAVERIGLSSRKELGTTEHGHRHAYGYRSRKAGLDQVSLQKAMHHKSPVSSLVYTKPSSEDVRSVLRGTEE